MRPVRRFMAGCVALGAVAISTNAPAVLNTGAARGKSIRHIPVAGRQPEICVIPRHFTGGAYSHQDLKNEQELCTLNEYSNATFCPKLSSTNPAIEVFLNPPGYNSAQLEVEDCKVIDPATKVEISDQVAKYKLSTSCSYSPSILGYYHMSRIFGNILNVQVAVIRTLDLRKHIALGKKALAATKPDELIHQTWTSLYAQLTQGASAPKRDLLLTSHLDQTYGALLMTPAGASSYKEMSPGEVDHGARAQDFTSSNPTLALVANLDPVAKFIGKEFTQGNVQKLVQMKDVSDMIVLDTIMSQQDRFGNIDSIERYFYIDREHPNADGSPRLKKARTLDEGQIKQLGAVLVKEMLLSDNDCGVVKDNIAKQAGLPAKIAHIDPKTYYRLLRLNTKADQVATKAFFEREVLFTAADYARVRGNLKELVTQLQKACTQGKLNLDLDLASHFSGKPHRKPSCEL